MTAENALNGKVCVSNLNPGVVRHEFLGSLLNLVAHDLSSGASHIGYLRPMRAGGLLDVYRNQAAEMFLVETDCEWLLFVDSDMLLPTDLIDKLLSVASPDENPVVGALYYMTLDEGPRPSMFTRKERDGQIHMVPFDCHAVPENELVTVDGTGCGALMIHRSLLLAMVEVFKPPAPWFAVETFDNVRYGEDFTFCMRVKQMGYDVKVYTGVECGHVKDYVLNGVNARLMTPSPEVTE